MNAVANCVVHRPTVTPEEKQELGVRALLILGERPLKGFAILHTEVARHRVVEMQKLGALVRMRDLEAPHGQYQALSDGETNIIAVHYHTETGLIRAHGPFQSHADAYDYFPDDASPHNTVVSVAEVFADTRTTQEREPSFD